MSLLIMWSKLLAMSSLENSGVQSTVRMKEEQPEPPQRHSNLELHYQSGQPISFFLRCFAFFKCVNTLKPEIINKC